MHRRATYAEAKSLREARLAAKEDFWKNITVSELEAMLSSKPTLDTDLALFLTMSGLTPRLPYCTPYTDEFMKVRKEIRENYERRRAEFPREQRRMERLAGNGLRNVYYSSMYDIRTIRDLKEHVGTHVLCFKGFRYGCLGQFNKVLREHKIEPMEVKARDDSTKVLRKYGLQAVRR